MGSSSNVMSHAATFVQNSCIENNRIPDFQNPCYIQMNGTHIEQESSPVPWCWWGPHHEQLHRCFQIPAAPTAAVCTLEPVLPLLQVPSNSKCPPGALGVLLTKHFRKIWRTPEHYYQILLRFSLNFQFNSNNRLNSSVLELILLSWISWLILCCFLLFHLLL